MAEGDDEDMWLECIGLAMNILPDTKSSKRLIAMANEIYEAIKAATKKATKPVTQLKSL